MSATWRFGSLLGGSEVCQLQGDKSIISQLKMYMYMYLGLWLIEGWKILKANFYKKLKCCHTFCIHDTK